VEAANAAIERARMDGALMNALTGLGTGKDRSSYIDVGGVEMLDEGRLDSLYMTSWLCRRVVELIASEATRAGWDISLGDDTAAAKRRSDKLIGAGDQLQLRSHIQEAARLARHHGGAAVIMVCDDGYTPLDEPINWKRLRAVRGLYPMDRWRLWPAPGYSGVGMPEKYQFNVNQDADLKRAGIDAATVTIHASRLLRIEGEPVPWRLKPHFQWWGCSCLQVLWDIFKRFETGMVSAADILHDFDLVTHTIPGLKSMLGAGQEGVLRQRLEVNAMARSVYGAYILGDGEELKNFTRTAAGISDILDRLRDQITGATRIPHTKLWGESPSGLGATGRSEDRSLAADVATWQEDHLQGPLRQFYGTLMRCKEGPWSGDPPDEWRVGFRPTFTMTDDERADLMGKMATADAAYINAQVLKPNEVALARFGRADYSLDTTLIDRESDGSIPQEEQDPGQISFGGDLAPPDPNAPGDAAAGEQPGGPQQQQQPGAGGDPGQAPPAAGPPPRQDAAEGACCESCAAGKECEENCPAKGGCGDEDDPEEHEDGGDDPSKHKHPDKVGQVMHRWKHGTLHSGTGVKGEHRGEVDHPTGRDQAIAIALSIAGKNKRPRGQGRRRNVRADALITPGRQVIAGVPVDVREDGTGQLVGPYGVSTAIEAAIGLDDRGIWEVTGPQGSAILLGVEAREDAAALAGDGRQVRPIDALDLAAMGVRCDCYGDP
jgi:phage-related protein (TIGR01555 family)